MIGFTTEVLIQEALEEVRIEVNILDDRISTSASSRRGLNAPLNMSARGTEIPSSSAEEFASERDSGTPSSKCTYSDRVAA